MGARNATNTGTRSNPRRHCGGSTPPVGLDTDGTPHMTTDNPLGLSRRTILAGLGSVGAIGVAGRVGADLVSDSREFPRHTLAASNAGGNDLLVAWQQWYSPRAGERRPVNAHPDDDGDGVQSYAGTTYDVGRGTSALAALDGDGTADACCAVADDALAVDQDAGEVRLSEAFPFRAATEDERIEDFYGGSSGDPATGLERDGAVRFLFYQDGIGKLYLVVLLGDPPSDATGATVSFDFPGGLPAAGEWVITGDDGTVGTAGVDFEWTAGGDGGAYGPLEPPFVPVLAEPDFSAVPDGEWEVLSAGADGDSTVPIALATDRLARLSDHCGVGSGDEVPLPEAFRSGVAPGQMALVELNDVMPGDTGEVVFDVRPCNTGVYVWLLGTAFSEGPGVTTEPEAELGPDEANLGESVMLDVRYAVNKDDAWTGDEPPVFAPGFGPYTDFEGNNPATLAAAFDEIGEGSFLDVLGGANAIPLDGDDSTPLGWDDGPTSDDRDCLAAGDVLSVRVGWEIPTAVGNEIQGDEVGFTLGFYAEGCENSDGTIGGA